MTSLKTISTDLTISIATVSNALSGKGKMSDELREKILKYAASKGYEPNPHARVLHGGALKVLGLVIPSAHDGLAQAFITGVDRAASEYGYSSILSLTYQEGQDSTERELQAFKRLSALRISGAIYLPAGDSSPKKIKGELKALGIPSVLLFRTRGCTDIDSVLLDLQSGARSVFEHLRTLGHTNIAVLFNPSYQQEEGDAVRHAFQQTFPRKKWEQYAGGFGELDRLLQKKVTAFFALSDDDAFRLHDLLRERGFRVPDDISLVGFRDTLVARTMTPRLTTLHVPAEEMGYAAALSLIEIARRKETGEALTKPSHQILPLRLVIRESCGKRKEATA